METKLLDQAFGKENDYSYDLEQWIQVDDDGLILVTVRYDTHGLTGSSAEVILIDTDNDCKQTDVVLRDFPSRWWNLVPKPEDGEQPVQEALVKVAANLVARMLCVLEPDSIDEDADDD